MHIFYMHLEQAKEKIDGPSKQIEEKNYSKITRDN